MREIGIMVSMFFLALLLDEVADVITSDQERCNASVMQRNS